jgi:chromosome segregation ATPase
MYIKMGIERDVEQVEDELRNLRDKIINLESALDTIASALMDDKNVGEDTREAAHKAYTSY